MKRIVGVFLLCLLPFSVVGNVCFQKSEVTFAVKQGQVLVGETPVTLKGLSWTGLETSSFSLGGLDVKPMSSLFTFLQTNNFNALRVPYSLDLALNLGKRSPTQISYVQNPHLGGLTAAEVLDQVFQLAAEKGISILLEQTRFGTIASPTVTGWMGCANDADGKCVVYTQAQEKAGLAAMLNRYGENWNLLSVEVAPIDNPFWTEPNSYATEHLLNHHPGHSKPTEQIAVDKISSSFHFTLNPSFGEKEGIMQAGWSLPAVQKLDYLARIISNPTTVSLVGSTAVCFSVPHAITTSSSSVSFSTPVVESFTEIEPPVPHVARSEMTFPSSCSSPITITMLVGSNARNFQIYIGNDASSTSFVQFKDSSAGAIFLPMLYNPVWRSWSAISLLRNMVPPLSFQLSNAFNTLTIPNICPSFNDLSAKNTGQCYFNGYSPSGGCGIVVTVQNTSHPRYFGCGVSNDGGATNSVQIRDSSPGAVFQPLSWTGNCWAVSTTVNLVLPISVQLSNGYRTLTASNLCSSFGDHTPKNTTQCYGTPTASPAPATQPPPTATPIPATQPPTATPVPATQPPTATPIPATQPPTATPIPATQPPTATPTATPIPATQPPTATPTATPTPDPYQPWECESYESYEAPQTPSTASPQSTASPYSPNTNPTIPALPTVLPTIPPTVPATIPPTIPATIPPTVPATVPPTIAPTQPATVPPTQPATIPPTQPATIPPTQPATVPPTQPATQAPTSAPVRGCGIIITVLPGAHPQGVSCGIGNDGGLTNSLHCQDSSPGSSYQPMFWNRTSSCWTLTTTSTLVLPLSFRLGYGSSTLTVNNFCNSWNNHAPRNTTLCWPYW